MPDLELIKKEKAKRHLRNYIKQAWPIVEPGKVYVPGWHIDAICEHLEAVSKGQIQKLLINMPPRHMKSLLVSVFWPTWCWINNPTLKWVFSSYAQSLSIRDSLKCRRIIESQWYKTRWGDIYKLTSDQNAKTRFENDKTGHRIATSVEGAGTGEGGDVVVVDDPHNIVEADSDIIREKTIRWWDESMSTRLDDPKTGAHVILMQRVHQKDLSGHVLDTGGYVHLCLPAEFEPARKCITSIGWEDPRKEPGDLLWPKRFGEKQLDEFKRRLGVYAYAGQMQQRPTPAEGGILDKKWLQIIDVVPETYKKITWCRYWDLASSESKRADYTAGALVGITNNADIIIKDIVRWRATWPKSRRTIKEIAHEDGTNVTVGIEAQNFQVVAWQDLMDDIEMAKFIIRKVYADRKKEDRAKLWSVKAEAGKVYVVNGTWLKDFYEEVELFPFGAHDDQIDAVSGAVQVLVKAVFKPVIRRVKVGGNGSR